jgi:predicted MPP superfamily phosphohydrolase
MRVALLSDFHVHGEESMAFAKKAIQLAVESKPEAIILAGDFLNNGAAFALPLVTKALSPLANATCPVLAILGNHDGEVPQNEIGRLLERSGVQLLLDEGTQIGEVTFLGFRDAIADRPNFRRFRRASPLPSTVVLLHEPDYVAEIPEWASIQLSGHSHGGQICLPFEVPVHCPAGGENYVAGFYPQAPVPIFVSKGVGTTGVDLRINCPPEINLLTLSGAATVV